MHGVEHMLRTAAVILVAACFPFLLFAQHQHPATPTNTTDGSKHPELVPDSTAYRLYFLSIAELPNASPEVRPRQISHLSRAGLQGADCAAAIAVLGEFRAEYDRLIQEYNNSAQALIDSGLAPNNEEFRRKRDVLVHVTRDLLREHLSKEAMAGIDADVQREKSNMKVDAGEAQ